MSPKVETRIYALEAGVEGVMILDGKVPHAVQLEFLTDHGAGTLMTRQLLRWSGTGLRSRRHTHRGYLCGRLCRDQAATSRSIRRAVVNKLAPDSRHRLKPAKQTPHFQR
jgi:hypothetical protein